MATGPLQLRIELGLKQRLEKQCQRLNISMNAFSKMALTKMIEEEEQIEANNAFRRTR